MNPHPAYRLSLITRRDYLRTLGREIALGLRPVFVWFTSVTDELAALMRWCAFAAPSRFVGVG